MKHRAADPANAIHKTAVLAIATATGSTSLLVSVWFPFLPLYLLQVGAKDEPAALFWVAVGMSALGVGRLIGGPLWGSLSDRLGRKKMFVRAVYSAALTSLLLSMISALGVWILSARFFRKQRLRKLLAVTCVLTALGHLLLALSDSVWLYVLAFTVASFLNASMMPATNTMIALNVSRDRRGTAFGIASAAQSVAFMVGPMGAAMFATISLKAGFVAISVLLLALAALVGFAVREPSVDK